MRNWFGHAALAITLAFGTLACSSDGGVGAGGTCSHKQACSEGQ